MKKLCRPLLLGVIFCFFALLPGCDQVARHKVLSTIFDGVPSLPPPEDFCKDYQQQQAIKEGGETVTTEGAGATEPSAVSTKTIHQPYAEKQCNSCHDFEKEGGLKVAANQLCFTCHEDFIQGGFVHGPVAVADCLACHLPHNSPNTALLIKPKESICSKCHGEPRLALKMHENVAARQMTCLDCHNPHFGANGYFLE